MQIVDHTHRFPRLLVTYLGEVADDTVQRTLVLTQEEEEEEAPEQRLPEISAPPPAEVPGSILRTDSDEGHAAVRYAWGRQISSAV